MPPSSPSSNVGAAPRAPKRRHGPFLAAALSALFVLVAVWFGWKLAGPGLVEAGHSGRSDLLARLFGGDAEQALGKTQREADLLLTGTLAAAFVLLAAAALGYILWHWRGPRAIKLGAWLAAYALLELAVAPRLLGPWGLGEFYYVRQPDHRPLVTTGDYNRDALRGTREPEVFTPESWNLVFLGDSFTYGAQIPVEEAFPGKVEKLLAERFPEREIHVANFGWPSSSPLLSWRRLVDVGEHYHPDVVAIAVDMTDFQDDIKYAGMLERRGIFWWSDRVPVLLKLLKQWAPPAFEGLKALLNPELPEQRFFMSLAPLEETRASLLPLVSNLERIDAWCREHGARFAVFLLPRNYQYSDKESPKSWERREYVALGPWANEPFRFFDEIAPTLAFPVHSLLPAFQETEVFPTCLDWDPHWNPAGATVAAEAIAAFLVPTLAELERETPR